MASKNKKGVISCDNCGNYFPVQLVEIRQVNQVIIKGKKLDITYFRCPHCKKVYIVQLADEKFKKLQDEYRQQLSRLEKNKKILSGEQVVERQYVLALAKRSKCQKAMEALKNLFSDIDWDLYMNYYEQS